MVFFRRHKKLSHKQCTTIGFVLAVLSLLTTALLTFVFPRVGIWLNMMGVYHLDLFLLGFMVTLFLAVQALLLFGFPLFYAQDKKSHMTGFQILLYALLWMLVLVVVLVFLFVVLGGDSSSAMSVGDMMIQ